jgi:hypothetical protein
VTAAGRVAHWLTEDGAAIIGLALSQKQLTDPIARSFEILSASFC